MNKEKLNKLMADEVMIGRADLVNTLLDTIPGEDPDREGLKETPWRIAKMYDELFWGYKEDPEQVLLDAMFEDENVKDLVVVKNIPLHSMCEHHMMPFFGVAHVAYIPNDGRIVGISKLNRLVNIFARRLQVQERIGAQVAGTIDTLLKPKGVAVIIEAEHTCMTMRGVQSPGTQTVTAALRGVFDRDDKARAELYSIINK